MKICFIADSNSIHTQRIIGYSVRQGDDVLVLSTSLYQSEISGTKTIHLLEHNRPLFRGPHRGRGAKGQTGYVMYVKSLIPPALRRLVILMLRTMYLLYRRKFCVKEIETFDPEVIYCSRSSAEGILASFCHVRPMVLRTAGPDISKLPKYPVFRQLIRKALKTADVVITQSIWEKELLRKLCGPALNPEIIIIGVDSRVFKPPASRDYLRDKYKLPRDAFVVVTNRSLEGHYNGWLVVEAIKVLLDECPKLVLFYASPSKVSQHTKQQIDAITSRLPRIKFLDDRVPHTQVPEILGCGDVYVSVSSYDGIPNSVLEAMACGVVPVVAELPQLHEWIEHGISGYFVPQRSVDDLASRLRYLYQNHAVLSDISKRCIKQIADHGSYEHCMTRTRELLKNVVRVGRRCNPSDILGTRTGTQK